MKGKQIKVIAPLENFECARQPIDLGENLRIRGISDEERGLIRDAGRKLSNLMPPHGLITGLKYGLETFFKSNEKFLVQVADPSIIRTVYGAVSALRLYKAGNVGCNMLLILNSNPSINFSGGLSNLGFPVFPRKYMLADTEIEEFKKFWNIFKTINTTKEGLEFLEAAVRRFNYAYERQKGEDKLVDHMISFESLFLTNERELGFKLSLRVAVLLAKENDKREKICRDLRNAYRIRNKVVHGAKREKIDAMVKKGFGSFNELSANMEDYLRKSIRAFYEKASREHLAKNLKHITIHHLDQGIFDKKSLTRESS